MNNLKFLRQNANLTLRQTCEYSGVQHSTIAYLESEKRPFRAVHIEALCNLFNCSSDFLLGKSNKGIYLETKRGVVSIDRESYVTNKLKGRIHEYIEFNKVWRVPTDDLEAELAPTNDGNLLNLVISEIRDMSDTDLLKVLKFIKEFIKNDS